MLTPYLHLPAVLERLGTVLERLGTWREGARDREVEPEWSLIRAGSSLPAGRGLNDGLNVLEIGEHADKGEEGAEEGSEEGKAGREKSGLQTPSSSSLGLGE